jgi:hypothetical protein
MADEVSFGDSKYISSKRASELSGYTQDYIGQLARASLIDARRIGGLWYVLPDSLSAYKTSAESYKPEIPAKEAAAGPDTVVTFDGKDYVSAARAGKITGYHQDYVGQLARSGKIDSRQIGNRWFVNRAAIEAHKQQKDALLAVVQAEAVGIRATSHRTVQSSEPETFFSYTSESQDLIPAFSQEEEIPTNTQEEDRSVAQSFSEKNYIPIRIGNAREKPQEIIAWSEKKSVRAPGKSSIYKLVSLSAFTIVIVLTVGFASIKSKSLYAFGVKNVGQLKNELAAGDTFNSSLARIAETIEKLLGHEEIYVHKN